MNVHPLPVQTETQREIVSYDPGTGAEIGRVPLRTPEEVRAAVERARNAQPAWANLSFRERRRVILQARQLLLDDADEVAQLISRETGKPVAEALAMEIVPTLDAMHYFAQAAENLLRPQKIDIGQYGLMGRSSRLIFKPVGVVGIIAPWNFPLATPAQEVVMALMAGNAVVLKPSELTPLIALKIGELFKRAGLPEHLLEVVTGDGSTGAALVGARVDKIMFTGSVATGKRVAEAAAKYLTPVVLELGGKDPMIILEDADINNAARGAVWGAFANSGQACASVERCYVQVSIADKFIERVVAETKALKQGVGSDTGIDVGSMSNERQLQIVSDHVEDAKARGAQVLTGGRRTTNLPGLFYEPTVLTNVDHRMTIMRDETFGPVLPVMTFKTEAEAIHLANDSLYGLTASVWTRNIARGQRVAALIHAGTVMVNEVVYTHGIAQTPWGGIKESGYGRTHGRMGLLELVNAQHVHVNRVPFLPDLWWFSYSPKAAKLFGGLASHFTTGSLLKTTHLLPQIVTRLFRERRFEGRSADLNLGRNPMTSDPSKKDLPLNEGSSRESANNIISESTSALDALVEAKDTKLEIRIENKLPVELADLMESFHSLREEFNRFVAAQPGFDRTTAIDLCIKDIRSGSTILDVIALAAAAVPAALPYTAQSNQLIQFGKHLRDAYGYLLGKAKEKPPMLRGRDYVLLSNIPKPVANDKGSLFEIKACKGATVVVIVSINSQEADAVQEIARRFTAAEPGPPS